MFSKVDECAMFSLQQQTQIKILSLPAYRLMIPMLA